MATTIVFGREKMKPEIFQRKVIVTDYDGESYPAIRYGLKAGDQIIIPAEYNAIQDCEGYGFIARKEAYYYAFNADGVMFVEQALGMEPYGRRGILVYEDAAREKPHIVPWIR